MRLWRCLRPSLACGLWRRGGLLGRLGRRRFGGGGLSDCNLGLSAATFFERRRLGLGCGSSSASVAAIGGSSSIGRSTIGELSGSIAVATGLPVSASPPLPRRRRRGLAASGSAVASTSSAGCSSVCGCSACVWARFALERLRVFPAHGRRGVGDGDVGRAVRPRLSLRDRRALPALRVRLPLLRLPPRPRARFRQCLLLPHPLLLSEPPPHAAPRSGRGPELSTVILAPSKLSSIKISIQTP